MQTQIQSRTIRQFSFRFRHQDCQALRISELDCVFDICCFCCPNLSALRLPFISLEEPNGESGSYPYLADKSWARECQGRDIKVQGQTESLKQLWWTEDSNNMQSDVWLTVQSDGHWQQHPQQSPQERILLLHGLLWLLLKGLSPNFSLLLWSETL